MRVEELVEQARAVPLGSLVALMGPSVLRSILRSRPAAT